MKQFLSFALFIVSFATFCQSATPFAFLKRSTDSTQIFKATVAGQPATFFIRANEILDCKSYEYYVDGYYFYNKYREKIPLTGIYSAGDLYLYHFKSERYAHRYRWAVIPSLVLVSDSIAKASGAVEIMGFRVDHYSEKQKYPLDGHFEKISNKQKAQLFTKNSSIFRNNEFLILPDGKEYLISDLYTVARGNELLSVGIGKDENRIVLKFNHPSNENFCGMCGADGNEIGYQTLTFDKNWNFQKVDSFYITSCYRSLENIQLSSKNENLLVHHVKDSNGKIERVTVNLAQSFITKETVR